MKLKFNMLAPMVIALSAVGFVQASEQHQSSSLSEKATETTSYEVRSAKDTWNFASNLGLPVTVGMTSDKLGECRFAVGPVEATVNLDVGSRTTVTLVPLMKYPNGVLTLVDIRKSSGTPDAESTVSWEAEGKQHACVANLGNYSTHRTITKLVLEYGKAAQVKLSDQSVFEITASAGRGNKP